MPVNHPPKAPRDLPDRIPIFPLPGVLLLPRGEMPLNIFEPRYLAMIDDALAAGRIIGLIQPRAEEADPEPLFEVGCAGRLVSFAETGDGRYRITLAGLSRFRVIGESADDAPYRRAVVDFAPFSTDLEPHHGAADVDRDRLVAVLRDWLDAHELSADWESIDDAPTETLVNALAMMSPFGSPEKQALLEAPDLKARAEILVALTEIDLASAERDLPLH